MCAVSPKPEDVLVDSCTATEDTMLPLSPPTLTSPSRQDVPCPLCGSQLYLRVEYPRGPGTSKTYRRFVNCTNLACAWAYAEPQRPVAT